MKNKTFTYPEYLDMFRYPHSNPFLDAIKAPKIKREYITYYLGKRLFFLHDHILVWSNCEYCNTEAAPKKDENHVICSKCGAPNS